MTGTTLTILCGRTKEESRRVSEEGTREVWTIHGGRRRVNIFVVKESLWKERGRGPVLTPMCTRIVEREKDELQHIHVPINKNLQRKRVVILGVPSVLTIID